MRPMKLAFCLMFILGLLSAANLQGYLHPGENETGTEQFTYLGAPYTIVSIDGKEALLLKDGEIVRDLDEMQAALHSYYVDQYYPSQSELDEMLELFNYYHETRNNGDFYNGIEEDACRMSFFLGSGFFTCTNASTPTNIAEARGNDCYILSSVVCEEYGDYLGCSDPLDVLPLVRDFAFSSDGLNKIQNRTKEGFESLSEDNIYSFFQQLKEDISSSRDYEQKLETTIFRLPARAMGDECNDCLGICTPIIIGAKVYTASDLNFTAQDNLIELNLSDSMGNPASHGKFTNTGSGDMVVEILTGGMACEPENVCGTQVVLEGGDSLDLAGKGASKLRLRHYSDTSYKVWAKDETALDNLEDMVDEMLPQLEYIGEYEMVAQQIYNITLQREEYYKINLLRAYYSSLFEPEEERALGLIVDANDSLEFVSDSSVLSNSNRVSELLEDINSKLNDSEFGTLNASRNELNAKLNVLEGQIALSWEIYENVSEAKEMADSLFFTLETSGLSEEDEAEFSVLKSEKRTQDLAFVDGLSPEKYLQLTDKYLELGTGASNILQKEEATGMVVDTFKGAGMKTNSGLSDLVTTVVPLQRTEREEISGYAPLVLSSLSFFSLSSLAVFMLVFVSAVFSGIFRNKLVLLGGILVLGCSLLFAGVVSGGIYFVLSSSSTDASFMDFQSSVLSSDQVSIMLNSGEAPSGAASAMMGCAEELASELEGREVVIYERLDGSCLVNGSITLSECYNTISEPIIVLAYSTEGESPEFSTGFVYKGTFYGDEEYFSACQLAKGFVDTDMQEDAEGGSPGGEEEPQGGNETAEEGGA
jgi:hypothetical protein